MSTTFPAALVDRMAREIGYFLKQEGATDRLTDFAEHALEVMRTAGEVRVEWATMDLDEPDTVWPAEKDRAYTHSKVWPEATLLNRTVITLPWVEVTPEEAKP